MIGLKLTREPLLQSFGRIAFDDLNWERRSYSAMMAYSQSKLANMMFALELQRRLAAAGSTVTVTAAHPGWTATDLQRTARGARFFNPIFGMKPQEHQQNVPQETKESAKNPGKDDVHEQRQPEQPHEGTVSGAPAQNPPPRH